MFSSFPRAVPAMLSLWLAVGSLHAQDPRFGLGQKRIDADDPQSPAFAPPLVDEAHRKAWLEFRGLLGRRQWVAAFRAVSDDLEQPPAGLLPPVDDFAHEWRWQVWRDLGALDAEARRAFILYFEPRAQKLLDAITSERLTSPSESDGVAAELATIFFAYGLTPAGTRAGDRLAAARLEAGAPGAAIEIWEWIIKCGASAGYDPRQVRIGLCKAFAKLGERAELDRVSAILEERWGAEPVVEGGVSRPVKEWVAALRSGVASRPAPSAKARLELPDPANPRWETETGRRLSNRTQRVRIVNGRPTVDQGDAYSAVGVAFGDGVMFVNDGRTLRGVDLATGQPRWTKSPNWTDSPRAPWVQPDGERVFVPEPRQRGAALGCRNAADGSSLWVSDGAGKLDCIGPPLVVGAEAVGVFREPGTRHVMLAALDLKDGRVAWTVDLGTCVVGTLRNSRVMMMNGDYSPDSPPETQLLRTSRHLVVAIDGGGVIGVDLARRALAWACVFSTSATGFEGGRQMSVIREGPIAYMTFEGCDDLVALDLERARVAWRRRIDTNARLVAIDSDRFYVLGQDLCAYARPSRNLLWSRSAYGAGAKIVESGDHLYVLLGRALHEIAKATGDDVRVVRGQHEFFRGNALCFTPRGLVSIGERTSSFLEYPTATSRPASLPTTNPAKEGL